MLFSTPNFDDVAHPMVEYTLEVRISNGEEMARVYGRVPIRERAMISLIAKSGGRLEVIRNYDGTNGFRIKDDH